MPKLDDWETGVYVIKNLLNGKRYIGSASLSFHKRWRVHKSRLRLGNHPNDHLQKSWNKNGEDAFEFSVLERCPPEECLMREQAWLDSEKTWQRKIGYNKSPTATGVLGTVWSDEAKRLQSLRKKGVKPSAEAIRKRTEKQRGLKRTAETKAKMSASAKAVGVSKETREGHLAWARSPEGKRVLRLRAMFRIPSIIGKMRMSAAQKRRYQRSKKNDVGE